MTRPARRCGFVRVHAAWLCACFALGSASAAAETLDDFSKPELEPCWQLSRGTEFPGARGELGLDGAGRERALELHYDFQDGGVYVAAVCEFARPRAFRYVRVLTRVADDAHLGVRVRDASGQWLQYRARRPLGVPEPAASFSTTLALARPERHWGGANDGRVHEPLGALALLVEGAEPHAVGTASIDEVDVFDELTVSLAPNSATLLPIPNAGAGLFAGLGVALHDLGDEQGLDAAKSAGFSLVRTDLFWERSEPSVGRYDFSAADRFVAALERRRLQPLFVLGLGHAAYGGGPPISPRASAAFAAFARAAAAHFVGHGVRFEVWNEPNLSRFWPPAPDATAVAALELAGARAVHAGDAGAEVVTGGLSWFELPFLRALLAAGGARDAQAIGVHPYRELGAPETLGDDLVDARRVVREQVGRELPLWDTEWGYPTTAFGDGHSESARRRQAAFAVRRLLASRLAGLAVAVWYDLRDDGSDPRDPEQNFGLLARDGSAKPALVALRALHALAAGRSLAGLLDLGAPLVNGLVLDGAADRAVVLWTTNGASATVHTPLPASATDFLGAPLPLAQSFTLDEERGPVFLTFAKVLPAQATAATSAAPPSGVPRARPQPLATRGCSCGFPTGRRASFAALGSALIAAAWLRRKNVSGRRRALRARG